MLLKKCKEERKRRRKGQGEKNHIIFKQTFQTPTLKKTKEGVVLLKFDTLLFSLLSSFTSFLCIMLFTSSTKTLQISKQIDTARCKGHWHALPDLARRYVKHNPEGAGKLLCCCAVCTMGTDQT
jgi:hypothetical protein